MAQQNPWKKQMQQNRNPTSTDSTAPISQFPPQEKITPPWMKNKQPTSTTTPVNNQPAWMKNNPSNTNNESGSAPPWMKAKQNTSNDTGSTPPWMKAKQAANNTPGQLNKPSEQSTTSGPAWMQKKPAQQQSSNVPAWKAGGTAFGADKKKKQEEERLRKEQEERERLEREQEERKRLEKEKEEEEEKKARQRMGEEDRLSRQWEQNDRQKQIERKRLEQEKKRHQEEQERLRSQKKNKSKSSSKHQIQVRSPPNKQTPLYTQYLYYFTQSTNQSLEYKQKLANQMNLLRVCHQFTHQMQQKAIQILTQTQQNPSKPLLSSTKKNKIINLDEIRTQVYYGFCEGQQNQQSSSVQLNAKQAKQPTIKFDMSQTQKLQKVFHFYNNLTSIICSLQKKQPTIMNKFRTPLFSFIQYKGIAFLSQSYTQELLQTQALLPFELKEIMTDFGLIEKDLKEKYHYHLGKTDLSIKKLFVQEIQQQVYIIYLKNWDFKVSKHAQVPNQTSIQQLTTDYYFLTKSIGRKFPLIPEGQFQVFKKVKTQAFSQLADVIHLAQCIFVVYSSCQGQVQQKEFWELILSQSDELWNLIRFAGYKGKLYKDKRFLFKIFELYSGVEIKFETKKSSKQQKLCVKETKCIKAVYEFIRLEFNQVIRNFDKYLKDNRYELAQHSLQIFKDLQTIINPKKISSEQTPQEDTSQINSQNYILHHSKLLISKQQFRHATKMLQQFVKDSQTLKNKSFVNIPIKMQLLVLYIKLKQQTKILQIFSQLLQVVEFYFGADSLINATLYQMLGSYYSLKPKQPQNSVEGHVITLYEHALSIVLRFYGDQSEGIAEVYLSRAVAFLNLFNFDLFYKDIDHALKIFKSHSRKKDKIAECLFHKGRAKLFQTNNQAKSQGIQLIEQSSSIYYRISYFSQAIDGFLIVIQILDEKVDESMKKIQIISNHVIETLTHSFKSLKHLSKAISVIMTKIDSELKGLITDMAEKEKTKEINQFSTQQEGQDIQQKHKQLYTDFELKIKGFSNFVEMVKWLGWTAISMVKTQSANSTSTQKFISIAQLLSSLMTLQLSEKNQQMEEQNEEQLNSMNSQSQGWNQSEPSKLNKSTKSQRGQYSPIGQMQNNLQQ